MRGIMSKELKPCPFCGGEAELTQLTDDGEQIVPAKIGCPKCHIGFMTRPKKLICGWPTDDDKKEAMDYAIRLWNRRKVCEESN